jgi:hypothetical protein
MSRRRKLGPFPLPPESAAKIAEILKTYPSLADIEQARQARAGLKRALARESLTRVVVLERSPPPHSQAGRDYKCAPVKAFLRQKWPDGEWGTMGPKAVLNIYEREARGPKVGVDTVARAMGRRRK